MNGHQRTSRRLALGTVGALAMGSPNSPDLGVAQAKKLAEILDQIKHFCLVRVSLDDFDQQDAFGLTLRDLVVRLQALARPILPVKTMAQLDGIEVEVGNFYSAARARAELDAIVPSIEDAIAALDSQPKTLLPGSMEQLLQDLKLDSVIEEVDRALRFAEIDPPVAVTAARAALEALLKVYIEDRGLTVQKHPRTSKLLKDAMSDLGLDPGNHVDNDLRVVLQGLWSIVKGIAALRSRAGSAHGRGRRPYRLRASHARLAIQASQTFIEFFVETWQYENRQRSPD